MTASSLRELIQAAQTDGCVDPVVFARVVFAGHDGALDKVREFGELQAFARAALGVLSAAMEVNADEAHVIQWFNQEQISLFAMRTPAEVVAAGQAIQLTEYVESLEAGASG
jgi:hypothetical protein